MLENLDEVLTPKEAAAYMKISQKLLYQLIKSGELKAKKVGKLKFRILKSELNNYLRGNNKIK